MKIKELTDLLDIAIDREIASEAFYIAGQKKTADPGAIELLKELAAQEARHREWVKKLKETGLKKEDWRPEKLTDLKISEYLVDVDLGEGAGLQDVITAAMKREQYSVEFYAQMKQIMVSEAAGQVCEKLIQEERKHKSKLEKFYDDLFNQEN